MIKRDGGFETGLKKTQDMSHLTRMYKVFLNLQCVTMATEIPGLDNRILFLKWMWWMFELRSTNVYYTEKIKVWYFLSSLLSLLLQLCFIVFLMPYKVESSVSDPYHLVGSGSVSGNVDMDPGSAKN